MSDQITGNVAATMALEEFIQTGKRLLDTTVNDIQPNPITNAINWATGVLQTYQKGDRRKEQLDGLCDRRGGPPLV